MKALRDRTINGEIVPMMCGTAFKNKGVQAMLDAVIEYLPSPVDIPPVSGTDEDDQPITRERTDEEKFSALAFKLMTDPYVGQLTFVRVYSGVLNSGDSVYNPIKGKKERIGRILQMHANQREEIKEILAGDIAACVGLKEVTTGETLCDPEAVITLEKMVFPEPVISQAVEPKTKADQEKMAVALYKLAAEDPSFRVLMPMKGDVEDAFQIGGAHGVAGGAVGGEAALFEEPDAIGILRGEGEVVGDDEDELAGGAEGFEELPEFGFVFGIEVGAGFVEEENRRLLAEGGGDEDAMFFAAA